MRDLVEIASEYLSKLESGEGNPEAREALVRLENELLAAVHEAVGTRRLAGLDACVDLLAKARRLLERKLMDAESEAGPGLSPAELGSKTGLVTTLEALLRNDPAYDLPEVLRQIAKDGVKMMILCLIRESPLTKSELSRKVPGRKGRARTLQSITPQTKDLVRAGLTYETTFGAHRLVNLTQQGERLLRLVEEGRIPGDLSVIAGVRALASVPSPPIQRPAQVGFDKRAAVSSARGSNQAELEEVIRVWLRSPTIPAAPN